MSRAIRVAVGGPWVLPALRVAGGLISELRVYVQRHHSALQEYLKVVCRVACAFYCCVYQLPCVKAIGD